MRRITGLSALKRPSYDPLVTLRLFADIRQSALKLRGLDTPDRAVRAKLIRDPEVYHALIVLLGAARKLTAGPNEDALFWQPTRETYTAAERRFDELRSSLSSEGLHDDPGERHSKHDGGYNREQSGCR